MRKWSTIVLLALVMNTGATVVHTCLFDSTFRAYLDHRFWQPFAKFAADLVRDGPQQRAQTSKPFAGMSTEGSQPALQAVWYTYRSLSRSGDPYAPPKPPEEVYELCTRARAAVVTALQTDLTEEESEEVRLVDGKIDMREGEARNQEALRRARDKLQAFLATSRTPALASEARGWLARVHYLLGEYQPAAKIYMDELSVTDSALTRESLFASLHLLFSYNGSRIRLADHLEEYFDTPRHALFVVNLVTNPIYFNKEERRSMAAVAKRAITTLQHHRELFRSGAESGALALALMRAALYMGDPEAALTYSRLVPPTSATASDPEFNWMTAACYFLQRDYAAAETPLLKMYQSKQADDRDRSAATQALIGVYQKLGHPVDQLHAAFLYYQSRPKEHPEEEQSGRSGYDMFLDSAGRFIYWPCSGWLSDLPYLLDIQLTDQELRGYLQRYPQSSEPIWQTGRYDRPHHRSVSEIVEYALAVRHARREEYAEAAAIYRRLGSWPRAARMQELTKLYAEATDPAHTGPQHLEAQYTYAAFLADHPEQIFFNDMLWGGFQRWVFIEQYGDDDQSQPSTSFLAPGSVPPAEQGLTRQEREFFLHQERGVRDEQEERWRAYKILAAVVDEAGDSELGKRAARKALSCLVRINPERFGRKDEIAAAMRDLANWLRQHPAQEAKEETWTTSTARSLTSSVSS